MSKPVLRLEIAVSEQHVGALENGSSTHPEAGYIFTYDGGARENHCVSLVMPTTTRVYLDTVLMAPFEQGLPEMDLSMFPNALWKLVTRNEMGILWASSKRRIGRLGATSHALDSAQPQGVSISTRDFLHTKNGQALFDSLLQKMRDIPGISGIQPKLLVTAEEKSEEEQPEPPRRIPTDTHIVKASLPDYPWLAINEHLCLQVCRRAGLETANTELSGDGRLILIRRFDLAPETNAPLGFDEVCALQGRRANEKYDGTLEEAAQTITQFAAPQHRNDSLKRFFILCVVNNALRNGDAHLKNFGLLYSERGNSRLAPVYDVVTTRCYEHLANDLPAIALNEAKVWDDYVGLADLGTRHCGLAPADVAQVYGMVSDAIRNTASSIDEAKEQFPAANKMLDSLKWQWRYGLEALEQRVRNPVRRQKPRPVFTGPPR